ncbi:hypothetical protein HXX76_014124 [Chlamydomonas incerta]|uniref:ATP-dependent RNA helicase n=1 Tax=Chlamydomonas incerta TaxID=51695 RepID=A0A835SG89_CHLIN|nr:hypothetical protein HXX76_014124 [Chlamydomonas incerta]|eukprot:KAG2424966.1 hypothetical protein HXX76_014124 [Chlamydomonas incerta]
MHASTLRAIHEVFGYKNASAQQARFLPVMLQKPFVDVFVRAGTGSGKTLGFLIPAIEQVVTPSKPGMALVLSPSRELALQTLSEADKLLTFQTGARTQAVIGGTNKSADLRKLLALEGWPHVLVATPGRLEDLMSDARVNALLSERVRVVVLDEADRLLEQGFLQPIRRILSVLKGRQRTLLLTATVPEDIKRVAKEFMAPNQRYVDASNGGEGGGATSPGGTPSSEGGRGVSSSITQYYRLSEPCCVHLTLYRELHKRTNIPDYKVLVFLPSKRLVDFMTGVLTDVFGMRGLLRLHGDMPQLQRSRNSDAFREGKGVVMLATDAAGRGLDFPAVTCVMQMGVVDADTYQQRIGRTGRAGLKGDAVLVLGTDERPLLKLLESKGFSIRPSVVSVSRPRATSASGAVIPASMHSEARSTFVSTLGAYKSQASLLGWKDGRTIFDNVLARFTGMGMPPVDPADPKLQKTFAKMGLKGARAGAAEGFGPDTGGDGNGATMVTARLADMQATLSQLVENNSAGARWGGYDDLLKRVTRVEVSSSSNAQDLEAAQLAAAVRIDALGNRVNQVQQSAAGASGDVGNVAAQVGTVAGHMDRLMATVDSISNDVSQFQQWQQMINDAERINRGIRTKLSGSTPERAVVVPSSNSGFLAIDASVPNKTHLIRAADHHELLIGQMDDSGAPLPGGYDVAVDGDPATHRVVALGPLGGGTMSTGALASRQGADGQAEVLLASLEPQRQVRHFGPRHVFDVSTGRMPTAAASYSGTSYAHGSMLAATSVGPNRKTAMVVDGEGLHLERHTIRATPAGDLLVCDSQSPDTCQTLFAQQKSLAG